MKLNLIYDSKCKINTKWWNIKMKTHNLTQISLRNDPINRWMHGFSFQVSEDEVWSSRCEFFFLFRSKFDFKSSVSAEMSQEYNEMNGMWNDEVHNSNLVKIHGRFFLPRRTEFKERFWGSSVGWRGWSRSMVAITRPLIESSLQCDDRPIVNKGSRCILILWRRRCAALIAHWILIQRSWCLERSTDQERSQPL